MLMKLSQSTPSPYFVGGREYVHAALVFNPSPPQLNSSASNKVSHILWMGKKTQTICVPAPAALTKH